jgi:hypothetical protein
MFGKAEKDSNLESQSQQIDDLQISESPNSSNDLDLLASLQKMKTEEQALLEQKQRLVTTEQNLHNKLIKEMERKKIAIKNLKTEILDHINTCEELSQGLGVPAPEKSSA